ncbi:RidA family protein [Chryseobacterium geocarposphaerae]|uniref:Enamine deaminase RidA (YjgF/YER057c/UK114 family) n=1 Tax=Chryseobacterium geocarposphaerae TaxID=1416776 RepID=A0A2M9C6J7_9FLAO|nr:RidA family protein [Chryseobacterium geocarposphaerae]PJJ66416.1 enamine deaminase RidA (YjgF/YER057c/UK114 family) [Chryseobacterium geocarposphaerae]
MMRHLIIIAFILVFSNVFSQKTKIQKEKWHWNHKTQDSTAGYTQAIKVDNVIYISGVVTNNITPEGITSVYNNLKTVLSKYGATFDNVVKENLYTTDIEAMKKHNNVRKKFYNNDFPAATWIQVQRLYMPDSKLEVELVAHLPK